MIKKAQVEPLKAKLRKAFIIPRDSMPACSMTNSWYKAHRKTTLEVKGIANGGALGFIWQTK